MTNKSNTPEIESALLICADDPRAVSDRIAQLAQLGDYRLLLQPDEELTDVHFDTRERTLASHGLAFRARTKDDKQLLTLKGASTITAWGGVKRTETEVPWSHEGWRTIASQLQQSNIALDAPTTFDESPTAALRQLGFVIIQERVTQRRVRNIAAHEDDRLAELAIDAVVYQLAERTVRIYEIEVEAKSRDASAVLTGCVEQLTAQFATTLRLWPHGKLATGLALERLLHDGRLDTWLDAENQLTAGGCRALEMVMRASSPSPFPDER